MASTPVDADGYRLLAENASDVVFRASLAGRIEWMSPSVKEMLDWEPAELVGTNYADWVHPDDLPRAGATVAGAMRGEVITDTGRFRCRSGDYRWFSVRARPVTDAEGTVVGIVGGGRSIDDQVRAEQARDASQERFARLFAGHDAPMLLIDPGTGEIVDANRAAATFYGYPRERLVAMRISDINAASQEVVQKRLSDAAREQLNHFVFPHRLADGSIRTVDVHSSPIEEGDRTLLFSIIRDVTEDVAAREALRESEERYRLLAENASDVVWLSDPDGRIAWTSEAVTRVLGWTRQQMIGRNLDLVHPDDLDRAILIRQQAVSGTSAQGQIRIRDAHGAYRWMAITSRPLPGDEGMARVVSLRDITDEVQARAELEHALGHDPLTGLATRSATLARLSALLERAAPTGRTTGVLCAAIDSLSEVVNALTHAVGDRVLTTVTARLVTTVGDADLVGRGSGNEFFVLVPGLPTATDAALMAEAIRAAVRDPIHVEGNRIDPTISVGITAGTRGDDPERLLRDASLAMRQAKTRGRDGQYFADPDLAAAARDRLAVEAAIRDGIRDGCFHAWYQPIVSLDDAAVAGYEALVRWVRPDGEVVAPGAFLPVAEATGLVRELDLLVLDQALTALGTLPASVTMSVNAAAASLDDPSYPDQVLDLLQRRVIAPSRLHLEITETTLLTVTGHVQDTIQRLATAGIAWYVDDFGTGYSSISHLRDLPISGLKLDRSFTSAVTTGRTSRQLANALAVLADSLGLDTVAEGIETRQQAAIVAAGWKHGQGWLYGRPAPTPL